ncbi:hypothetical protein LTS18_005572 [Coniosporium uncinatum]|uniref:Uncharacterized protein n=1 Tax=Coniosporium uncinatum TaxID=93489 RepID=A0ACC3D4H0_9PEZI|nr:hypothetical protein LTS18_005572 [Coniosporium uncinatum]
MASRVLVSSVRTVKSAKLFSKKSISYPAALRQVKFVSLEAKPKDATDQAKNASKEPSAEPKKKKTMAELDEELRMKMQGIAGDGGDAGIELEDGQPVSMKRSVKNNMFRYI